MYSELSYVSLRLCHTYEIRHKNAYFIVQFLFCLDSSHQSPRQLFSELPRGVCVMRAHLSKQTIPFQIQQVRHIEPSTKQHVWREVPTKLNIEVRFCSVLPFLHFESVLRAPPTSKRTRQNELSVNKRERVSKNNMIVKHWEPNPGEKYGPSSGSAGRGLLFLQDNNALRQKKKTEKRNRRH